ncbi:MAG: type II toxin-antitoxin system RelE/ParE family toxin [Firmicutes bacterium]|nr:type II toxin-antitoxin system RelE/ParE family toxin [Bacillota bacterium]
MNVELAPKAAKYLKGMRQPDKGRIVQALEKLPRGNVIALQGVHGLFRLHVGDWRVVFSYPAEDIILVEQIGPRGEIYKGGF